MKQNSGLRDTKFPTTTFLGGKEGECNGHGERGTCRGCSGILYMVPRAVVAL